LLKGKIGFTLRHNGRAPVQCLAGAAPKIAARPGGKSQKSPMMPEEKNIKNV
jgi:hypothetical protein